MSILGRSLQVLLLAALAIACSAGLWFLWWYAPVSVGPTRIVKVLDSDIHPDQVAFCNAFAMTPDAFSAYWQDVRPIFEFELHDYSIGACQFEAKEDGKEYAIGIGGVGMVTKGGTTRYYVRKSAKPELGS